MRYIKSQRSTLKMLFLDSCSIEEEAIPLLCDLNVRAFQLCDQKPSEKWLDVIASMKELEELHLWHISDFRAYSQMLVNLPNLKHLVLHDVPLTSEDVVMFKKMKKLETLSVDSELATKPEFRGLTNANFDLIHVDDNSQIPSFESSMLY